MSAADEAAFIMLAEKHSTVFPSIVQSIWALPGVGSPIVVFFVNESFIFGIIFPKIPFTVLDFTFPIISFPSNNPRISPALPRTPFVTPITVQRYILPLLIFIGLPFPLSETG